MVAMRVVGCRIGLILFLVLSGIYGGAAWAQQCAVRVGVLGNHSAPANNKVAKTICETQDFNCTYTELSSTTFNGMSVAALRDNFDVLLFAWHASDTLNADWTTRLLPFLNRGGGIIYEQPGAWRDLSPGVVVKQEIFNIDSTVKGGTDFAEIVIANTVSGLTNGILDGAECTGSQIKTCFANTHLGFSSWQTPLVPFLKMTGRRGKTDGTVVDDPVLAPVSGTVVGLHGEFSGGGRMVLSGPDNNLHGVRNEAANQRGRNQYNLLLNALRWVSPGCAPQNQAPVVNAGADRSVPLSSTLTLAGSASDDGLPDGTLTVTWTKVSGPGSVTFGTPDAAQTDATFSSAGTYTLRLTADDGELTDADEVTVTVTPPAPVNEAPVVSAGADRSVPLSSTLTLNGSASDDGLPDGTLTVTWTKVSGPGSVTFGTPDAAQTDATFSSAGTYILRLTADDGELTDADEVTVTVTPPDPVNEAPVVSAGADRSVPLSSTLTLAGSASDDGLPDPPGTLTVTWTKVSGPGSVTFDPPDAAQTDATFSSAGTYILRLTADDGELTDADEVTVTVTPPDPVNEAPVVNAGADRSVPLSSTLTLAGSASDDGLPDPPGTLTVTWTKVSGPGSVTFGTPDAAQTDATFSSAGTYILRLTADDGELTDADEVTVTVTPPDPVNEAPVVNAGADRSVKLSSTLTLAGSASDDGLPDGTLTVTWTQVSGPGSTTFGTPGAAETTARFSSTGIYTLRLTADDGELSASDEVRVTVKP